MPLADSLATSPIGTLALLLNSSSSVRRERARSSTARVLMPPAKLVSQDNACVVCTLALRRSLKMPTRPKIKHVEDSSGCGAAVTGKMQVVLNGKTKRGILLKPYWKIYSPLYPMFNVFNNNNNGKKKQDGHGKKRRRKKKAPLSLPKARHVHL